MLALMKSRIAQQSKVCMKRFRTLERLNQKKQKKKPKRKEWNVMTARYVQLQSLPNPTPNKKKGLDK
jgi:hypothetical protein